jgi:hypothetical protein
MKNVTLIILIILLCAAGYTSTAASFLDNGISARSDAMGRAFSAVADDLDAFYYNPAGYAGQRTAKLNTMGTRMNNIYNVYYLGGGMPLGVGFAAVNFFTAGIDDIPETSYDGQYVVDSGNTFEYASRAVFLSYGLNGGAFSKALSNFSFGFSVKNISEVLYENKASGTGLDAGIMYTLENLNIGFSIINLVEPQMKWDTESGHSDEVLRREKLGLAYRFNEALLLAVDTTLQRNNNLLGLGLEYNVNRNFAMRVGSYTDNYMFGLGFNYNNFNLDYAFIQPVETLVENTHKISIGYVFGGGKEKIENAVAAIKQAKQEDKTYQLPTLQVKEKQPTPSAEMVSVTKNSEVAQATVKEQITPAKVEILKKTISLGPEKIKCYYRVANQGGTAAAVKYTVILLDANDVVRGQESGTAMILPNAEELIAQDFERKGQAPFRVKVFINSNDQQSINSVDQAQ